MEEIWKDIQGYEGLYQVSNLGNVKGLERIDNLNHFRCEKIIKQCYTDRKYRTVALSIFGKEKNYRVHRLVAQAFIENNEKYQEVNHIDGNKSNNTVENLEWCDHKHNMKHASINKLCKSPMKGIKGKHNHKSVCVNQYDADGNFIKTWENISIASKKLNICYPSIVTVCRKNKYRKTAGGYRWEYVI